MADSREMTFGLDFGLKDAIDQLEDIVTRLEQAVDSARDAEEAGRDMGAGIQAGADTGAAGLRNMRDEAEDAGDSLDNIGTNFRAMGREASGPPSPNLWGPPQRKVAAPPKPYALALMEPLATRKRKSPASPGRCKRVSRALGPPSLTR